MSIHKLRTPLFLTMELILYYLILTTGGQVLVWSSFLSIVLCFLHAALHWKDSSRLVICGLAFTVLADFCLVVCFPIQQLWGMVFFTITQSFYAIHLQSNAPNRILLTVRLGLTAMAALIAWLVLGKRTDALALLSICYYANLIMNIAESCTQFRRNRILPIALVLFLLCDTVIGLQAACGAYLTISEDALIHRIIFCDFNLSWLFYLPSQVLLSLACRKA